MTHLALPLALGCTAALALTGWWSATRRGNALQRQVDAYRDEDWHTAEEMAEFAGRCAWHDYSTFREINSLAVPPMVQPHLAASFVAGFDDEALMDRQAWSAEIRAALADGSLRVREVV